MKFLYSVICQLNSFLALLSQVLKEAIYFHQVEYTKHNCRPNPISKNEVKTFKKCPLELRHCKELFSFWGTTNRLHFSQWTLSHAEKSTFSKPLNFSNKSWDWNVKQLEIGKLRRRWWPLINGFRLNVDTALYKNKCTLMCWPRSCQESLFILKSLLFFVYTTKNF